jgi:protein involved in sex pheromone biosynthesis
MKKVIGLILLGTGLVLLGGCYNIKQQVQDKINQQVEKKISEKIDNISTGDIDRILQKNDITEEDVVNFVKEILR